MENLNNYVYVAYRLQIVDISGNVLLRRITCSPLVNCIKLVNLD